MTRSVAYMDWSSDSGIADAVVATMVELGHRVLRFPAGAPIPREADVVLVQGPFGSLVPLAERLLAIPAEERPSFVLWQSEQLWDPRIPTAIARRISAARSRIEQLAYHPLPEGGWEASQHWQPLLTRGMRFRYFGDMAWLQENGLLSLLVVPSDWLADFLRQRGIGGCQDSCRMERSRGLVVAVL